MTVSTGITRKFFGVSFGMAVYWLQPIMPINHQGLKLNRKYLSFVAVRTNDGYIHGAFSGSIEFSSLDTIDMIGDHEICELGHTYTYKFISPRNYLIAVTHDSPDFDAIISLSADNCESRTFVMLDSWYSRLLWRLSDAFNFDDAQIWPIK